MYKISDIETDDLNDISTFISDEIVDLRFSVTVKSTNSKQLDSNIDSVVENQLAKVASKLLSKSDRVIKTQGEKIGELDIAFEANNGTTYFIEIEKSNKKTLWFDYVKLLTLVKEHENSYGIIICPKNYAHKVGTWNLYKEAVAYKAHLARVFDSSSLNRIYVIGYTQYAFLDERWQAFSPELIHRIKNT